MRGTLLALLPLLIAAADPAPDRAPDPRALAGDWLVDLTPKPGDEPYLRPMHLDLLADGRVTGLFYQSPIDAGRWKIARERICVSFRTHDDNGPYHSAGCLRGDRVEGQTWAEGRAFLFPWNATRTAPAAGEAGKP